MTTQTPKIRLLRLRQLINEELQQVKEAKEGQRVKIKAGMPEFVGQTGTVVGTEFDGRTKMYRVRLDQPVNVPGVGMVEDDLWAGQYLKPLREQVDHKGISAVTAAASKLLDAVEGFKEKAPPAAINAVTPHITYLEEILEKMLNTPGSYVMKPKVEPKRVSLKAVKK
jgi:hypothetical protein